MQSLTRWLCPFVIVSTTLQLREIIRIADEAVDKWKMIGPLLSDQLSSSFIGIQFIAGAEIPMAFLGFVVLMSRFLTDQIRDGRCFAPLLLLLLQVSAVCWSVPSAGTSSPRVGSD